MSAAAPYPGLRPFRRDEAEIFFGREAHTDQLLEKLGDTHFLAILGTSGSGKSSLVRAGLLPALDSGFLAQAGAHWSVAEFRPGDRPLGRLAAALARETEWGAAYAASLPEGVEPAGALEQDLRRGPAALPWLLGVRPLPEKTRLLILVDQFEELFRYHREGGEADARAFVERLLAAAEHPDVYVVLTMRSDFLGHCALYSGLPEAINAGLYLTPRLTREQMADAVQLPARVFGGAVEPDLVRRLLDDARSDPDQLPLLQHALMRLWQLDDGDRVLTMAEYEHLGGLKKALNDHAEEAHGELAEADRRVSEVLFRSLTERGRDPRGDTRRPVRLGEVADLAEVESGAVARVVDTFRKPERSFLTPPAGVDLDRSTILDISHEALIRQWDRLARWTAEEADKAELYRRLEAAALRWQQGIGALWIPPDLTYALRWRRERNPTRPWAARYGGDFSLAMSFLDASRRAALRRKLVLWGAVAAVFLTIGTFAIQQHRELEIERARSRPIEPEMVSIPAGSFTMGSGPEQAMAARDEQPPHPVNVRRFALGKYEVTFDEYDRFAYATGRRPPNDQGWGGGKRPVINVSWEDATAYARWLAQQTGKRYRLPTEAEWEYAARATTATRCYWGDDAAGACGFANVYDRGSQHEMERKYNVRWKPHGCSDGYLNTAPVGLFKPNAFGLYDMVGNVWEWVEDRWHKNYLGAPRDGSAWLGAEKDARGPRVRRGGSWYSGPGGARSALRALETQGAQRFDVGFRLARDL